jgi:hypothetical protein
MLASVTSQLTMAACLVGETVRMSRAPLALLTAQAGVVHVLLQKADQFMT